MGIVLSKITVEFENGKVEELNPLKLRNRLLIENLLVEVPRKTSRCPALVFQSLFDKNTTENVYVQYFGTKEVEKISTRQLYPFKKKEYKRDSLPLTVLEDLSLWLRQNKMQLLLLNGPYTLSPCQLLVYSNNGISYNGTLTEHNLFERKLNVFHKETLETVSVDPKIVHVIIKCSDEQLDMMLLGNAISQHFSRHTNSIKDFSYNSNTVCLNWNFPSWLESISYQEQFAALTQRPSKFFEAKQPGVASSLDTVHNSIEKSMSRLKNSIEIIDFEFMHETIRYKKFIEILDFEDIGCRDIFQNANSSLNSLNTRKIFDLSNLKSKLTNQQLKPTIQKNRSVQTQRGVDSFVKSDVFIDVLSCCSQINLVLSQDKSKSNFCYPAILRIPFLSSKQYFTATQKNNLQKGKEVMIHNLALCDLILNWVVIFDGIHIFLNSYKNKQKNDQILKDNLSENQRSHNSKIHGTKLLTTVFNKESFCTTSVFNQASCQTPPVFSRPCCSTPVLSTNAMNFKMLPKMDQVSKPLIEKSKSPSHFTLMRNDIKYSTQCPASSKIKSSIKSNYTKKLDKIKKKCYLSKMTIKFLKSLNDKSIQSSRFFEDASVNCKIPYFNFTPCCTGLAKLEKISAKQMRSSYSTSKIKKPSLSNTAFALAEDKEKFPLKNLYSGDALNYSKGALYCSGDTRIHHKKSFKNTEIKRCSSNYIFEQPAPKKVKFSVPFIKTQDVFQTLQGESKKDAEVKSTNFLPSFFHNTSQIRKKNLENVCNSVSVFEPKLQHNFLHKKVNNTRQLQHCSEMIKNTYVKYCPQTQPCSSTLLCQFSKNILISSKSSAKTDKPNVKNFRNTQSRYHGTVIQKHEDNLKRDLRRREQESKNLKRLLNFFDFDLFDANQTQKSMRIIEITDNLDLYVSQSSLVNRDLKIAKESVFKSSKTVPFSNDSSFLNTPLHLSSNFDNNKMQTKFYNNAVKYPFKALNNTMVPFVDGIFFPVDEALSTRPTANSNLNLKNKLTLTSLSFHDEIATNHEIFKCNKTKCLKSFKLSTKPYQIPYRLCLDQGKNIFKCSYFNKCALKPALQYLTPTNLHKTLLTPHKIVINNLVPTVSKQSVCNVTASESTSIDKYFVNKLTLQVLHQSVHNKTNLKCSTSDKCVINKLVSVLQQPVHNENVLESSTSDNYAIKNPTQKDLQQSVYGENALLESSTFGEMAPLTIDKKNIENLIPADFQQSDENEITCSISNKPFVDKFIPKVLDPSVCNVTPSESSTFKKNNLTIPVLHQSVHNETNLERSTSVKPPMDKLMPTKLHQPVYGETSLDWLTSFKLPMYKLMPTKLHQPVYGKISLKWSVSDKPPMYKLMPTKLHQPVYNEIVLESLTADQYVIKNPTQLNLEQSFYDETASLSTFSEKANSNNLIPTFLEKSVYDETVLVSPTINKTNMENLLPTTFQQSVYDKTGSENSTSDKTVINNLTPISLEQPFFGKTTPLPSTFNIENLFPTIFQPSVHDNAKLECLMFKKPVFGKLIPTVSEQLIYNKNTTTSEPSTFDKTNNNNITLQVLQNSVHDETTSECPAYGEECEAYSDKLIRNIVDYNLPSNVVDYNLPPIVLDYNLPSNSDKTIIDKQSPKMFQQSDCDEIPYQTTISKQTDLKPSCQKLNLYSANRDSKPSEILFKLCKFGPKESVLPSEPSMLLSSSKKIKSIPLNTNSIKKCFNLNEPNFTGHHKNKLMNDLKESSIMDKKTHNAKCGENVQPILNSGKRKCTNKNNENKTASKMMKQTSTFKNSIEIELKSSTFANLETESCIELNSQANNKTTKLQCEMDGPSPATTSSMTNQKIYDKLSSPDSVQKKKVKQSRKRLLEKDSSNNAKKIISAVSCVESGRRSQRSAINNTIMRIRECQKNDQYNEDDMQHKLAGKNVCLLNNTVSEIQSFIYKKPRSELPINSTAENLSPHYRVPFNYHSNKSKQSFCHTTYQNNVSPNYIQLKTIMHDKVQTGEQCTDAFVEKANEIKRDELASSPHSVSITTVTKDTKTSRSNNSSACQVYLLPSATLKDVAKCLENKNSYSKMFDIVNIIGPKENLYESPVKVVLTDCNKSFLNLKDQTFKSPLEKDVTDKAIKIDNLVTNQRKNRFRFPKNLDKLNGGDSYLQVNSCSYYPDLPFCIDCQSDAGKSFCRFIMFRRLDSGKSNGFCTPDDAVDSDLLHWIFDQSKTNLDTNLCKQILEYVGTQFQELVREEALAMNWGGKPGATAWKRAVLQVREMCDICATTMFNTHWTCDRCGFAVCLDCFLSTLNYENSKGKCNSKWPFCQYNGEYFFHNTESLTVTQIIPRKVLFDLRDDLLQVCRQIGLKFYDLDLLEFSHSKINLDLKPFAAVPNSTEMTEMDNEQRFHNIFDKYKKIESVCNEYESECSWFCNRKMLHIQTPHFSKSTMLLFQKQWKQGAPIVVSNVHKYLNKELWCPEAFSRDFGHEFNDVVNCLTGKIIENFPVDLFWRGFESVSERPIFDGSAALLKLKDWPSGDDFQDKLPERFQDLMKALPAPYYTHRNGQLNLAARLPKFFAVPDLGPKMYNAYGSASHASAGTTNLHLDISDATNVIVYVGIPKEEEYRQAEINDAFKIIDSACCESTRIRIRDQNVKPGALWHIFPAKSAEKIRIFLRRISVERGLKLSAYSDPIHDQAFYLDKPLLDRLKQEEGVVGFAICQCLGDAVFIPAGAPHQVLNLHSCIKVAEDFVGPEHMSHCIQLTQEFRHLSDYHTNHEDKLQIKNILFHTVKDCLGVVKKSYSL
ncbi:uncharacterized protein LOC136071840 isoform X2 [Hydra vulgaris]|uniref:Uncharacterized protein LOC136071840 isoform X2 n=1 Tax=Hydra vulgaris TaxID=6087 RepID=A0ABM4BW25_HYDVU